MVAEDGHKHVRETNVFSKCLYDASGIFATISKVVPRSSFFADFENEVRFARTIQKPFRKIRANFDILLFEIVLPHWDAQDGFERVPGTKGCKKLVESICRIFRKVLRVVSRPKLCAGSKNAVQFARTFCAEHFADEYKTAGENQMQKRVKLFSLISKTKSDFLAQTGS